MLGIETNLSTTYHSQIDSQMKRMNQELKQYLQFFIDYRKKDWPKQLATAEFAVSNKIHSATKVFLFIVNYNRELRMKIDIRKKEKIEKVTEFAERIKKV